MFVNSTFDIVSNEAVQTYILYVSRSLGIECVYDIVFKDIGGSRVCLIHFNKFGVVY